MSFAKRFSRQIRGIDPAQLKVSQKFQEVCEIVAVVLSRQEESGVGVGGLDGDIISYNGEGAR